MIKLSLNCFGKFPSEVLDKDASNAFLAEEFVHDFQFMDKAVKEADKRKNLRLEKSNTLNIVRGSNDRNEVMDVLAS